MRNNEQRSGARQSSESDIPKTQMPNPMDFVTPTEFVDLPSQGKYYPQGHPLHNQETIEIRFMTAKDEDILTSRTLLKKGLALDRLISNIIVDKNIDAGSLLLGDRNAIIIAARSSAYGHTYRTNVPCPACGETSKHNFNLLKPKIYHGDDHGEHDVAACGGGQYDITLPYSKLVVRVRMLNGADEVMLVRHIQKQNKKKEVDSTLSSQMRAYIVSVNEYDDPAVVSHVVKNITASETRYLRNAYQALSPDLKISNDFECPSCGHEQELEVPFNADFFWPDR